MTSERSTAGAGPLGPLAGWLSRRDRLPVSVRSVFRYYAATGAFDLTALRVRGWMEDAVGAFLEDAFAPVERRVAEEFGRESVAFDYETKLTLPVELTLGYLYRRAYAESDGDLNPVTGARKSPLAGFAGGAGGVLDDRERRARLERTAPDQLALVERAEAVARLCTEALLDGDMRDAINDDEYGDFEVDFPVEAADRARIAELAQECLQARVEDRFAEFPEEVREEYEAAKRASEAHQAEDQRFRGLMERARDGSADALDAIESEYRFPAFDSPPAVLTPEEREWPYCRTQYERVGVIYDGMVEMFRAAGIEVEDSFKHAVVLAIIGAQVWLDDVDDYAADMAENQLTPVTAEYLLRDSEREAFEAVTAVSNRYLDRAVAEARRSDSHVTGIATEYIRLSGDPSVLPGSDSTVR